jgi:hypothetical protein
MFVGYTVEYMQKFWYNFIKHDFFDLNKESKGSLELEINSQLITLDVAKSSLDKSEF